MKLIKNLFVAGAAALLFTACSESGPKEIATGKDQCENCKMTITEAKYATQLVTEKGRNYKFDDISCMDDYTTSNTDVAQNSDEYVADFPTGTFFDRSTATLVQGGSIKSPMGGNTQAYKDKAAAEKAAAELGATVIQ